MLFERSTVDFFNDEQEVFLGDAIVAQSAGNFRLVDVPEATAHVDRIAERLLRRLPPSGIRLRFHVAELPESNAFALPGGHIYLSRKLIAIVRDEDEIAGVVAHEMGHILAHQSSSEIAGEMRRLLKIDKAGNRQEVFELYSRLEESYVRTGNPPKSDSGNQRRQSAADRIALFSLAAAGYDPEGLPRALDRITDLHGKTGNFLTDLFGFTGSDARRVRDMLKAASKLPAECVERALATDLAGFAKWQAEVAQLNPAHPSLASFRCENWRLPSPPA
jgi:predicted Zn-dependent protease